MKKLILILTGICVCLIVLFAAFIYKDNAQVEENDSAASRGTTIDQGEPYDTGDSDTGDPNEFEVRMKGPSADAGLQVKSKNP